MFLSLDPNPQGNTRHINEGGHKKHKKEMGIGKFTRGIPMEGNIIREEKDTFSRGKQCKGSPKTAQKVGNRSV